MDNIKKVGVICAYQFPEGMAPTIRILAYCKGLQLNGVKTEVFTFKETALSDPSPLLGFADGIPYKKSYLRSSNGIMGKVCDKLAMLKRLYQQVKRSNIEEPFDFVLLSFDSLDKLYTFIPLLKLLRCKLLFIGDEFPEPIRRLKADIPTWQKYGYRFIHRFLEGRILMTENIKKFYDKKTLPKPTYILNSIINEERFKGILRQSVATKYICYMGNMMLAKDNVDNIIKAFSLFSSEYKDYELWLFGTPSEKDLDAIRRCIEDTGTKEKVFIKGRVDFGQVPQILANAQILVTSQPITKRAEGGFPTKMAEYMMSHTPMIVTDVGEIHNYIHDGETAFMVKPCDPDAYAEKLRYIIQHPDIAKVVATKAYKYAKENFCAKPVTQGLIEFLSDLKEQ